MKDKEYYKQKEEAEQIKEDIDYEIIKDEKMTNKVTAIVDNLNNERVATIYRKEQTLSNKEMNGIPETKWYKSEDVKEHIKILQKELFKDPEPCCHGVRKIDVDRIILQVFGSKLVEQTQKQEVEK